VLDYLQEEWIRTLPVWSLEPIHTLEQWVRRGSQGFSGLWLKVTPPHLNVESGCRMSTALFHAPCAPSEHSGNPIPFPIKDIACMPVCVRNDTSPEAYSGLDYLIMHTCFKGQFSPSRDMTGPTIIMVKVKVKVELFLCLSTTPWRRIGGVINLGSRLRYVTSFTFWPLHFGREIPHYPPRFSGPQTIWTQHRRGKKLPRSGIEPRSASP
jgi:hypothetical protein